MPAHPPREAPSFTRLLADQVFARVAGVPLVPGNHLRLLRDAADHFPAWMEAIQSARRTIHFDSYIMRNDAVGRDFGNWELDVAVEDEAFARQMEETYLEDLANATEVVLTERRRPQLSGPARHHDGRARRAAAGAMGLGSALGASLTNRRVLGPAESPVMAMLAILLAALTVVAAIWPTAIAAPLAVIGGWVSISLLVRAVKLRRERRPPLRRAGGPAPPR